MQHPALEHFHYEHLPEPLRSVSKQFAQLACKLAKSYASKSAGELYDAGVAADAYTRMQYQVDVGLQKLLEAKDCFVRCERDLVGGKPQPRQSVD